MVANERTVEGFGDRGQLMLVGAVSMALILLGLVVVFNTVLYTDTKSASDALEDASEAQAFTQQVRNETQGLALAIYNDTGDSALPKFQSNVSAWSEALASSYANTGPVYVEVKCSSDCSSASMGGTVDLVVVWVTEKFRYKNTITVQLPSTP